MFGGTNGQRCIGVHGVSNVLFESRGGGRAGWFVGLLPVVVLLLAEYNWLLCVDVGVKQRGVQGGVGHNVDGASWPVWVLCGCVAQEVEEENEVWLHGGEGAKLPKFQSLQVFYSQQRQRRHFELPKFFGALLLL